MCIRDRACVDPEFGRVPKEIDQISNVLTDISSTLNDPMLLQLMEQHAKLGKYKTCIGCTTIENDVEHINDDGTSADADEGSLLDDEVEENDVLNDMLEQVEDGKMDLDDIMMASVHTVPSCGITPQHLSKVWRISYEDAKRTLQSTSQTLSLIHI